MRQMLVTGAAPQEIITGHDLEQVNDSASITNAVQSVLIDHPEQLESFLSGKDSLTNWFLGQVMRAMDGKANPQVVRSILKEELKKRS